MKALILLLYIVISLQADCCKVKKLLSWNNYPTTITAIAFTESSCRLTSIKGDDGQSFGVMQLQLPTARELINKDKSLRWLQPLSDKQLKELILKYPEVSLYLGAKHFMRLLQRYGYKEAIIRYNGYWEVTKSGKSKRMNGKRVKNTQYYEQVLKNIEYIKSLKCKE